MNDDERSALAALEQLLDLTDPHDWPLVHHTVRADVAAGKYGADFETAYRAMVDGKLAAATESPPRP